jgi:hypothetical protein
MEWGGALAAAAAFVLTVLMLTPFMPATAFEGIYESWPYAMNVAVAEHLRFGRDIVFTFGPLASVYTRAFHPATDVSMIVGSLVIAVAIFMGSLAIVEPRRRFLLLLLPFVISLGWNRDPLFMMLPVFLPLVVRKNLANGKAGSFTLYLLAIAAALLPLVKVNFSLMVGASTLCTVWLLWRTSRMTAMVLCVTQALTVVIAWLLTGQALVDLPTYLLAQGAIISGYTNGMSMDGRFSDMIVFVLAAAAMIATMLFGPARRPRFEVLLIGLYLFIAFKSGFVRHDGHALMPAVALVFVALLTVFERAGRTGVSLFVIGFLGWAMIATGYQDNRLSVMSSRFGEMVRKSVDGIRIRMTEPEAFANQFRAKTAALGHSDLFAGFRGTADLYPENLTPMLAAGISWKPRPVFTSYATYTPSLMEANAEHLVKDPPARIYFNINPIDYRYPSMEDGLSWLALLGSYRPILLERGYAVLERPAPPQERLVPAEPVAAEGVLGKDMAVPRSGEPVWVTLDVEPTIMGRAFSTVYKLPELSLVLRYADGSSASYRFIAGMGHTGFLLSPTVANPRDFVALGSSYRDDVLGDRKVVAFQIFGQSGTRFLWKSGFKVVFSRLTIARHPENDTLLSGEWADSPAPSTYPMGGTCTFDEIDNRPVASGTIDLAPRLVKIRGWAALDTAKGRANGGVSLAFTDPDGHTRLLPAHPATRPDVANAFHQPGLADAGYEANVDVRQLARDVEVRVVQRDGDRQIVCGSMAVTIHRMNRKGG